MWNMQSGIRRRDFVIGSSDVLGNQRPDARSRKKGEQSSVTGLATDPLNRVVIASTLAGTINASIVCETAYREEYD
jgi:U3 small nucleolar RNA-associated protein 21